MIASEGIALSSDELEAQFAPYLRKQGLDDSFMDTIKRLHFPLSSCISAQHSAVRRPILIGICGPQGSGKSTAVKILHRVLSAVGLRVALLSIDDLYLPKIVRLDLARRVHPLLATRGPPGTHEVALGEDVIARLLVGENAALPAFDKAEDDRIDPSLWLCVKGPVDIVLFEGWCVGARPQEPAALDEPINDLERDEDAQGVWRAFVNESLANYQPLFARIDFLVMIEPPSFEVVTRWRTEQETRLRAERPKAHAMSDAAIVRFVKYFERLTRHILDEMPGRASAIVRLGQQRELKELRFAIAQSK